MTVHASMELVLFGQVGIFIRSDLWLAVVAFIVVVGLGIWVIWRWRMGLVEEPPPPLDKQVEYYRAMMERGQLQSEEFARIVTQLEKQTTGADATQNVEPAKDDQPPDRLHPRDVNGPSDSPA